LENKLVLEKAYSELKIKSSEGSWMPMAHIYDPRYSGGRDQEDRSLKPAMRPYLEKTQHKNRAG
jgi:hypothetical protein